MVGPQTFVSYVGYLPSTASEVITNDGAESYNSLLTLAKSGIKHEQCALGISDHPY